MSNSIRTDEELVTAIHQLPGSIPPPRELWPEISGRLARAATVGSEPGKRPIWLHQALAASVVAAFVAGLMFGRQMGNGEMSGTVTPKPDLAMRASLEASEREYQAAFREFIPVGAARSLLANQTVENIESSWADLQQAETSLLAALRDYPENTYLNQKLLDLRAQQLAFMRQLATLDQASWRKT
jgi:hypothetical protein